MAAPLATDPKGNFQHGGWYWNPTTGKSQQFWNGQFFDTPQQGGPSSSTSALSDSSSRGGQPDFFGAAMSQLQPVIQAQTAPLQQAQTIIPKQFEAAKSEIGRQQMSELGSQRATAAARGITSTSGVEQSQEANISATYAGKLTALSTSESTALLNVASQIAQIQGEGTKEALSYAAQMSKMVGDELYRQAEIAIQNRRNDIAQQRADDASKWHQTYSDLLGLGGVSGEDNTDPLGLGLGGGGGTTSDVLGLGLDLGGSPTAGASATTTNF